MYGMQEFPKTGSSIQKASSKKTTQPYLYVKDRSLTQKQKQAKAKISSYNPQVMARMIF